VLSPFTGEQRTHVDEALDDSVEALFTFMRAGMEQAMNDHN
jgi:peptidyl-tRNA hydrolase